VIGEGEQPSAGDPGTVEASADVRAPVALHSSGGEAGRVAALVNALWGAHAPMLSAPSASRQDVLVLVRAGLERVSAQAELVAVDGPAAEHAAATQLAETARALHQELERVPAGGAETLRRDALASSLRLRLVRMEQWLSERGAANPQVRPAADLCLWVVEHLDAAGL
jgi:hypothetical protein